VLGTHLNDHTDGVQLLLKEFSYLSRQAFLRLKLSCEVLDRTSELRQACLTVPRYVADRCQPDEGDHVVVADAGERDLVDDDHLIRLSVEVLPLDAGLVAVLVTGQVVQHGREAPRSVLAVGRSHIEAGVDLQQVLGAARDLVLQCPVPVFHLTQLHVGTFKTRHVLLFPRWWTSVEPARQNEPHDTVLAGLIGDLVDGSHSRP
jgi:hypothetical protein